MSNFIGKSGKAKFLVLLFLMFYLSYLVPLFYLKFYIFRKDLKKKKFIELQVRMGLKDYPAPPFNVQCQI